MKLIILIFAAVAVTLADAQHTYALTFTKDYITSGQLVDWYTCSSRGNYPDGRTCDHYIACTENLDAYQMPCAPRDDAGNRLHYVPTSGPKEDESYCDFPHNVQCGVNPAPSTEGPPQTTSPPDSDDCKGVKPGDPCNEAVDCHQCGYCDTFLKCDKGAWVKISCESKAEPDGTIRVSKKLFWNQGGNIHGGTCVPWVYLMPTHQVQYKQDPDCKPICAFRKEDTCDRKYYFADPDFDLDIWWEPEKTLFCEDKTQWDNNQRSCRWCAPGTCTTGC